MKHFGLLVVCSIAVGCGTNHYTEAILYEQNTTNSNLYDIPDTGNNPIMVDSDSVFQLEIEYMTAGWIHNGESMPTLDDETYKGFSDDLTSHLYGKELWLLTKIESLSSEDVLERNSKTYYKTTNIKLNSESFARIALDESERKIFAHGADSQYRITFKLYEVDGFDLKKAAVKAYDDSPGIAGIVTAAAKTITSTLGSLAGSAVTDLWQSASEEQLFIERLLLENDGTLEFQGTLHVLRDSDILADAPMLEKQYILYDKFKSETWNTQYSNRETYIARKKEKDTSVDISRPDGDSIDTKTYIKIGVTQALASQAAADRNIAPLSSAHQDFLNMVVTD